jgi:hypothetical protein
MNWQVRGRQGKDSPWVHVMECHDENQANSVREAIALKNGWEAQAYKGTFQEPKFNTPPASDTYETWGASIVFFIPTGWSFVKKDGSLREETMRITHVKIHVKHRQSGKLTVYTGIKRLGQLRFSAPHLKVGKLSVSMTQAEFDFELHRLVGDKGVQTAWTGVHGDPMPKGEYDEMMGIGKYADKKTVHPYAEFMVMGVRK